MFFIDPLYIILMLPAFAFVMLAQFMVKRAYKKWSQVGNRRAISGAQATQLMMQMNGMTDISIESTPGELSDHYDPRRNLLRLSPSVGGGRSVASLAIAAHELGHAEQDHQGYALLRLRSAIVPAVSIGSNFGYFLIIGGLMLAYFVNTSFGANLAWAGVALFSLSAVFALITLPVEFDASRRAIRMLDNAGLLLDDSERNGARAVLNAAALTYVAALGAALANVLYYVLLVSGISRRD